MSKFTNKTYTSDENVNFEDNVTNDDYYMKAQFPHGLRSSLLFSIFLS